MLTLIPFHKGDSAQASRMLNLSAKLGFVTNHQCVCMYPNDTPQSLIAEVEKSARFAFKDVEMFQIPHEIPENWPAGPNKMFATGCSIMFRKWPFEIAYEGKYQAQNGMFLWMEPDMVPLQPGYLDRLQQEYLMGGKPCLGVIVPTIKQRVISREQPAERDVITNTVPLGAPAQLGEKYIDGEHMVGAGVYDRGISALITWINEAAGLADPFDVTLQHEICQKEGNAYTRITPSQLIVHNWNSTNYRIVKSGDISEIECDSHIDNPGQGKFILSKYATIGPCLAHGCKDDSLHNIVEKIHGLTMTVRDVEIFDPSKPTAIGTAESFVNEKPQGMQIPNGLNPLRVQTAVTSETTQVIVGGNPYLVLTDKLNGKALAQMEAIADQGGDPMIVFMPILSGLNALQEGQIRTSGYAQVTEHFDKPSPSLITVTQSSSMTDEDADSDGLSPDERRILSKLLAKIDRRQSHKKKVKKVKSAKTKTAVDKKVIRKTVDESAVWNYYLAQPGSEAWKNTLREWRLSPRQLKEIREKNQATA